MEAVTIPEETAGKRQDRWVRGQRHKQRREWLTIRVQAGRLWDALVNLAHVVGEDARGALVRRRASRMWLRSRRASAGLIASRSIAYPSPSTSCWARASTVRSLPSCVRSHAWSARWPERSSALMVFGSEEVRASETVNLDAPRLG